VAALLDRLRNEAEASGVFKMPTFVFEGELFWQGGAR
jgi:2-hydroxychromene-2-carboxylate isomerase